MKTWRQRQRWAAPKRSSGLQGAGVTGQQVVEVDQPAASLLVLVAGVQGADGFGVGGQLPPRLSGGGGEAAGSTKRALAHSTWLARSASPTSANPGRPLTSSANNRPLRGSSAGSGVPTVGPPTAQLAAGQGVERAPRDRRGQAQADEAVAQLTRRLTGEGDGQGVLRGRRADRHPVAHPAGQHPGLAGTG